MITVSSEQHIYIKMAHIGICQRCTMLLGTHSLAPFFSHNWARTHTNVPGSCLWSWRPMEISDVFSGPELSGFGNDHVPSTQLAMLLLHTQDSGYIYKFHAIICFMRNAMFLRWGHNLNKNLSSGLRSLTEITSLN